MQTDLDFIGQQSCHTLPGKTHFVRIPNSYSHIQKYIFISSFISTACFIILTNRLTSSITTHISVFGSQKQEILKYEVADKILTFI